MRPTLLALVLLLAGGSPASALEVPSLRSRVTDLAGVLSAGQVQSLEIKLQDLEQTDSTQIAVLIIPSLEGENLEEYSHKVAESWRLGQKGRDNGALLLVAIQDRSVRIEVGYGLEAELTDLTSGRIIQDQIVPNFRQGNYYFGIDAGITAITQVVRGLYEPVERRASRPSGLGWIVFVLMPMFWAMGALGRWGGAVLGAVVGMAFAGSVLSMMWPVLLVGAVLGAVLGFFLGIVTRSARRTTGRRGGFGGWPHIGGGYSGHGGGGGFSVGGFSGGGGSFGGGGASGRW